MMAPFLIAAAATPTLLALWVMAWLVGDLLAGRAAVPVRVRTDHTLR
jgi:hypothetical protein